MLQIYNYFRKWQDITSGVGVFLFLFLVLSNYAMILIDPLLSWCAKGVYTRNSVYSSLRLGNFLASLFKDFSNWGRVNTLIIIP